jgi:hypothetical protein
MSVRRLADWQLAGSGSRLTAHLRAVGIRCTGHVNKSSRDSATQGRTPTVMPQ